LDQAFNDIITRGPHDRASFEKQGKEIEIDRSSSSRFVQALDSIIAGASKKRKREEGKGNESLDGWVSNERIADALDGIIAEARKTAKKRVTSKDEEKRKDKYEDGGAS
jgi:hypothetical protein